MIYTRPVRWWWEHLFPHTTFAYRYYAYYLFGSYRATMAGAKTLLRVMIVIEFFCGAHVFVFTFKRELF